MPFRPAGAIAERRIDTIPAGRTDGVASLGESLTRTFSSVFLLPLDRHSASTARAKVYQDNDNAVVALDSLCVAPFAFTIPCLPPRH